jgi:hypothetical protein
MPILQELKYLSIIPWRIDVRQAAGRKIIVESLSQHDEKHVVLTPINEIRVGKRRSTYLYALTALTPKTDCDQGLITCHICSIPHSCHFLC